VRLIDSQISDCVNLPKDLPFEALDFSYLAANEKDASRFKFTPKNLTDKPHLSKILDAASKSSSAEMAKGKLDKDFAEALSIPPR